MSNFQVDSHVLQFTDESPRDGWGVFPPFFSRKPSEVEMGTSLCSAFLFVMVYFDSLFTVNGAP